MIPTIKNDYFSKQRYPGGFCKGEGFVLCEVGT